MRFIRVICLILYFITTELSAQHPVYRHYTVDDGLASTEIFHVIQDSKGYIWIATNMGVSRFDGSEFRNFTNQDGLPENTVFEIYEDYAGRIWFISFPCQLSYYYNDSIIKYKYNKALSNHIGNYAVPIKYSFEVTENDEVKIGLLYIGLLSISNKGEIKNLHPEGVDSKRANLFVSKNRILISQGEIAELYNISIHSDGKCRRIDIHNETNSFTHRQVMAIKELDNQIIFAQNDLLVSFQTDGQVIAKFLDFRIFDLYLDRNSNLWVSTDKHGAFCYKKGSISAEPIRHVLMDESLSSVCEDNEGGFWFATLTNGLFYLPSENFITYSSSDGLTADKINAIALRKNEVLIGTNDEYLNVLLNDEIRHIKISETKNDRIEALCVDNNDLLWIGAQEYLFSYSNRGDVRQYFNSKEMLTPKTGAEKNSRNIFSIKTIENAIDGGLWIGESNCYSKFKDGRVLYNSLTVDSVGVRAEALCQLDNGDLYIGTINGLYEVTGNKIISLREIKPEFSSRITSLSYYKPLKTLVIGTKGSGLLMYDQNDKVLKINVSDGLSSNSISSLLIRSSKLWVGTDHGLNLIDLSKIGKKDLNILTYTKLNGLVSNEINDIQGDSNNIYIATNQGLTIFNYRNYKPIMIPPPVYINSFSIMKSDTAVQSGYRLSYNQNLITIDFIGISYRDAGKLNYKYRLNGLNNTWNYTANKEVEYAYLPPGDYEFEVVAINRDGLQSSKSAKLMFTILPPFWKTWWFTLILILIFALGVYLYYITRMKQIRKEQKLLSDMNWYRQLSLAKQMDPHFVFNTLNSIQSYIIKNDRLASSQYLSKFAKLMRLILSNSQNQAIPLGDEITALTLYLELESLRFQQKFKFKLTLDPSIDIAASFIPAFLIQPFVENAIWHGIMGMKEEGCIKIDMHKIGNQISCTIEDNGIGRKRAEELKKSGHKDKQSYGISIVESRLNLLNNLYGIDMKIAFTDLYKENGEAAGTRVLINLPLIS